MGIRPGKAMLQQLERQVIARVSELAALDVVKVMSGYAKVGYVFLPSTCIPRPRCTALPHFHRHLTMPLNLFSAIPSMDVSSELENRAETVINDFSAHAVEEILWAYATLGIQPGEQLLYGLEMQGSAMIEDMSSDDIPNMLWSYATLRIRPGAKLISDMERHAVALMWQFTAKEIVNTLWAYAKLEIGMPGGELVWALELQATMVMGDFNSRDISTTVWAYSALGLQPGAAMAAGLALQGDRLQG